MEEVWSDLPMKSIWYPPAVRRAGPMWKTSGLHAPFAAVYHSSEGNFTSDMNVLDGSIESSWHLYNPKQGTMLQHYPLNLLTWHARGYNRESIGVENEGLAGEPLTPTQVGNLRGFSEWLVEQQWLRGLTRGGLTQTLWEHNEVGLNQNPPYGTACPSGRIPWEAIMEKEEEMALILLHLKGSPRGTYWLSDWIGKRNVGSQTALDAYRFMDIPEAALEQEFLDTIPDVLTQADLVDLTLEGYEISGTFRGEVA